VEGADPAAAPDAGVFEGAVTDITATGDARPGSGLTWFNDPTIPAASSSVPEDVTDPLRDLAEAVITAAKDTISAVASLWADPLLPAIGSVGVDGAADPSAAVGLLHGSLAWYTAAVAVLCVLIAGGRMAWSRRGGPLVDLVRGLGTLVLVTGAGVTAVTLLVAAGDAFSVWLLGQVTDDVEAGFVGLLALPDTESLPSVLVILVGSGAVIGATLQVVLLIARGAVLVVLTGVLPLTAAATGTATGRMVFLRALTWIVAFALYQPVAALVYATAFLVVPRIEGSPVVTALTGTTFIALAVAALPALLRLLRPVLFTVTAGRAPAATGSSLPTGARTVAPATYARGAPVLHGAGAPPARLPAAVSGARPAPRMVPPPRRPTGAGGRLVRSAPLELPASEIVSRVDRSPHPGEAPPARRPSGEEPTP
jgi:hypothetical protein